MNPTFRTLLAASLAAGLSCPLAAQFQFDPPVSSPNPLGHMPVNGPNIIVMDLNGDQYPDIATSSYGSSDIAVFANDGDPGSGFLGTFTGSIVPGANVNDVWAANLDGMNGDDLIRTVSSTTFRGFEFSLNDGNGAFPNGWIQQPVPGQIYALAAGDLDGDGGAEIAVIWRSGSYTLDVFDVDTTQNPQSWNVATLSPTGDPGNYGGLDIVDFDGDGDNDIATGAPYVYQNDGNFAFTTLLTHWDTRAQSFDTGDVNGDGRVDLVVGRTNGSGINDPDINLILAESGCGQAWVSQPGTLQILTPGAAGIFTSVQLADLDRDGRDDLVAGYAISGPGAYRLGVNRSLGNGFAEPMQELIVGQAVQGAGIADFDLDGDLDIVGMAASDVRLFVNQTVSAAAASTEVFAQSATFLPGGNRIWVDQASLSASPNGTAADPFPTIEQGVSAAQAADVILVRPGHYNCNQESDHVVLSNQQLIAVAGPAHTSVHGIRFSLYGSRLVGFHIETDNNLSGPAITIEAGTCEVIGNEIFGTSPMDGVRIAAGQQTGYIGSNVIHGCRNAVDVQYGLPGVSALVHNNTIVGNSTGIEFGPAHTISIYNNLIVDCNNYGVLYRCSGSTSNLVNLEIDYNWLDLNGGNNYQTTAPLGATCGSQMPQAGPHDVDTSLYPFSMSEFRDAANFDFHIGSQGSYAVNRGNPDLPGLFWLGVDMDGDPRSVCVLTSVAGPANPDMCPDIGADEYTPLQLELATDASNWNLVTTMPSSHFEATVVSWSPGLQGGPTFGNSVLLVDSALILGTFPLQFGSPATHSIPRVPWLPVGVRLHAQSLVANPGTMQLGFTNAAAITVQ